MPVKLKVAKKLRTTLPREADFLRLMDRAALAARSNIRGGHTPDGKALPPVSSARPYRTTADDPRIPAGLGRPSYAFINADNELTHHTGKPPKGRFIPGGYAAVKQAKGKKTVVDGDLTGSMWQGLTASITTKGKEKALVGRVHFTGQDVVPAYKAKGRKPKGSDAPAPTVTKTKLPKQTKADALQERLGTPLLGWTQAQLDDLARYWLQMFERLNK